MCKTRDPEIEKEKAERKKKKELEKARQEAISNYAPQSHYNTDHTFPDWEQKKAFNTVKFFLIAVHMIVTLIRMREGRTTFPT